MNIILIKPYTLVISATLLVAGCSVAKLEARIEANPQCKEVVNPKTGALMPCPGTDKAFYREAGLAPAKPSPAIINPATSTAATYGATPSNQAFTIGATPVAGSAPKSAPPQADCKPQIHIKTGGALPCPSPD